jgi:hypothetical protein
MTKKLQRTTPNPTFLNPTLKRSKNLPQKSKKLPHVLGKIAEGRIDGRIHPKLSPLLLSPLLSSWRLPLNMTSVPLSSLGAIGTLLLLDQHSSSVDIAIVYFLIKPWILQCRINQLSAEFRWTYHQKKWVCSEKDWQSDSSFVIFACQRHFSKNCAIKLKVLMDCWRYLRANLIWMRFSAISSLTLTITTSGQTYCWPMNIVQGDSFPER